MTPCLDTFVGSPTTAFIVPGAVVGLDMEGLATVVEREEEEDNGFNLLPDFRATLLVPQLVAGQAPLVIGVLAGTDLA